MAFSTDDPQSIGVDRTDVYGTNTYGSLAAVCE